MTDIKYNVEVVYNPYTNSVTYNGVYKNRKFVGSLI